MSFNSSFNRNTLLALIVVSAGLLPLAVSLGVIKAQEGTVHAPMWVLGLCGLVFVIAGFMLLLGQRSRFNDLLAALICSCFGAVGLWVSLEGASENFSGGIPFVPSFTNVIIARWMFGSGAVICFLIALYAVYRFFKDRE